MNQNAILLVEGKSDTHVFWNIFKKHDVKESFKARGEEGDSIYDSLKIEVKGDYESIGIVIDADIDICAKWQKLTNLLTPFGYKFPKHPDENGTIVLNDEYPTLGIWIMPNNHKEGMLEDFVRYLIPTNDKLIPIVDEYLNLIESKEINRYRGVHKAKARIHTWLAGQEDPGTPMGLAIKKTYLDTNQELCLKFIQWINRLFNNFS